MSLRDIFDKHGCDRGSKRHKYDRLYETISPPSRMLEVGIFNGCGLASWLEWFPKAEIVGLDTFQRVAPEKIKVLQDPRVTWFKGDSRDIDIPGPFDLIIDDGDHRAGAQWQTFENLFPLLSSGGLYFIEDVWPDRPGYQKLLDNLERFRVEHHDLRGYPDSYILEIRC